MAEKKYTVALRGSSFPFHVVRGLDQGPTIFAPTIAMWRYAHFSGPSCSRAPFLDKSALELLTRRANKERGPAAIFSPLVRRIRVRRFVCISYMSSLNPELVQIKPRPLHRNENASAASACFYEYSIQFLLAIKKNEEISIKARCKQ